MATHSLARHGPGRSHRRGEPRRTGQWKLAYADFLTALMAFFLLMWLSTDSSEAERSAIAAYFTGKETVGNTLDQSLPTTDLHAIFREEIYTNPGMLGLTDHVRIRSHERGLRIDLIDADGRSLFEAGATRLNETGLALTENIGNLIADMPLNVSVEGHTDAFKTAPGDPSNWAISAARANAAQQALEEAGILADRFVAVTGLAATQPLLPAEPHAPANRRISILLELST